MSVYDTHSLGLKRFWQYFVYIVTMTQQGLVLKTTNLLCDQLRAFVYTSTILRVFLYCFVFVTLDIFRFNLKHLIFRQKTANSPAQSFVLMRRN